MTESSKLDEIKKGLGAIIFGFAVVAFGVWMFDPNDTSTICARGSCNSGSSVALSAIIFGAIFFFLGARDIYRSAFPASAPKSYRGKTPYGSLRQYEAHLRKIGVSEQQIRVEIEKYRSGG